MDQVATAAFSGAGIFGGAVCVSIVLLMAAFLALRILRYRNASPGNSSLAEFSLDRYRPMVGLLSSEDLDFLAAQPGCNAKILSRLRRDRRRIFRMYLRELAADFRLLHAEARKMAALSPEAHSEVIASLMRQQMTFWFALAAIEFRLLLPHAGGLDIRELIASVEALRLDVAKMAA